MAKSPESRMSASERFGRELARHRREAGLSQARLAERLGCSPSLVGHIETGDRNPQIDFAETCDRIFDLSDKQHFVRLCRRISESPFGPQWFLRWVEEIEPQATGLRTWDPLLVPGLLQTEAYARAIFRGHLAMSEREVEKQVSARMQRRLILDREDPPALWVLIDEWVLHRPIGGAAVMQEQAEHLSTVASRRHVTVQLVPHNTPCTEGLMSGFAIAELADAPITVSVESAATGEVSAEPEVVSVIMGRYDRIRTEAYRPAESLDKIKEAVARWTQTT
ncbi:helix-turn-helix domain-containing protein [Streptosporangium carneum]|uniref:Transcriptional regulator n=1 Tax=Streptosporangium carneum TaxID=47481 RepID=A0A9W6MC42_9ACTN|nr:helix-turn-helix transcriptional regulator [Streptosporangium carneum]GLK08697.1 transcriptional regulator [Streptosporangium carneum]